MGIKGLGKLLTGLDQVTEHDFSEFCGTKQAIDTMGVLYKIIIAIRHSNNGEDYKSPSGKPVSHLHAILIKIYCYLRHGILPCFVFDGAPPDIKHKTMRKRKKVKDVAKQKLAECSYKDNDEKIRLTKKTVCITGEQIRECQTLLSLFGIPYIQAIGEAEAQCAALSLANIVDGVVTEDYDALILGSKTMLLKFSNTQMVKKIELQTVLDKLELTHDQLIDLAAILGNDYCDGIKGLSAQSALSKYKKAGSMHIFLQTLRLHNKQSIPPNFEKNWLASKEYYTQVRVLDPTNPLFNLVWKRPDISGIMHFLCDTLGFDNKDITNKLYIISYIYNRYVETSVLSSYYFHNAIRFSDKTTKRTKQKFKYKGSVVSRIPLKTITVY
jgi:flap endonuclease-1